MRPVSYALSPSHGSGNEGFTQLIGLMGHFGSPLHWYSNGEGLGGGVKK
jgi:hypothetical protein